MEKDLLVIDEEDLDVEITIDERDIQKAAEAYMEWNQDLVVITPDDLQWSPEKSQRFYDQIRQQIRAWAEGKGKAYRYLEYILLAPDLFFLLTRLIADERVPPPLRRMLFLAATYFVWPFDAIPEGLLGPVGFLDDIVFSALAVLATLKLIDGSIVREHWSGPGDITTVVNRIASAGEAMLNNSKLWEALKRKTSLDSSDV